jgi:NAD(P)-dependent dehydrogenase (short-subunit alcohol dehydrogenase family)
LGELRFDGRVAIVTGAGGGLGRAHARLLASRGARVLVNDVGGYGGASAAETTVNELKELGADAVANTDTVATPAGGEAIVHSAVKAFGRVDIVINNAGILRDKTFQSMTPDLVDPVIDVHLKGALNVTRPAWIRMREQGYGRIVNTSSGSGLFGNFGQSNYGAAKTGLIGLTRVLANEGEKHNITANAIAPIAYTPMTEKLVPTMQDKLKAEFVSPLVAWLVHEDCRITGDIYSVAGGYVARVFIGVTPGVFEKDPTPEKVRDAFVQIRDETNYYVPVNPQDEVKRIYPLFND